MIYAFCANSFCLENDSNTSKHKINPKFKRLFSVSAWKVAKKWYFPKTKIQKLDYKDSKNQSKIKINKIKPE